MIVVALGSNLGFCGATSLKLVSSAFDAVAELGSGVVRSSLYESEAWPDPSDPPFINAVMALQASILSPTEFLKELHAIEMLFGRNRSSSNATRNAPRTLDLDLLDYHEIQISGDKMRDLVLPHPSIAEREFVLRPLAEILPDWRLPGTRENSRDLLLELQNAGATGTTRILQYR